MAIGPMFPLEGETPMHRVPEEWQHVVCICPEDEGTKHNLNEHIYMICRRCEKLKRFYSSYCRNCKQFYLMVFAHPAWSPRINWCYGCCLTVTNYSLPKVNVPPLAKFRYPAVLKTPEERAAALDDLLSAEVDLDF